jgi:hypothetical protein
MASLHPDFALLVLQPVADPTSQATPPVLGQCLAPSMMIVCPLM